MNRLWRGIPVLLILVLGGWRLSFVFDQMSGSYPQKPIQVVVPYTAGGGTDSFVRMLATAIKEDQILEQPLVILNQPGGSGTIGSRFVKDSRPDGYRVLCHHESIITTQLSGTVPFGPADYAPIAHTGQIVLVVVVREDSPFKTIKDLLQAAKDNPRQVRFGANRGSPAHFTAMKLEAAFPGAELNLITAGGGQKRYISLLGGHLEAGIFSLAEFLSFRSEQGTPADRNIRGLAVLTSEPVDTLPTVQTCRQQGVDVTSSNAYYWFAPKGTPANVVSKLAGVLERAMKSDFARKRLNEWSITEDFLKGDELNHHLENRIADLKPLAVKNQTNLPDFPLLTGMVAMALLIFVVVDSLRDRHSLPENKSVLYCSADYLRAGVCFLALVLYVLAMQWSLLPFAVSTALLVFVCGVTIAAGNRDRIPALLQIALLAGLGIEFIFRQIFTVALP